MTERSILLFGLPRSGTTWLGKIFDAHPETLYRHEPDSVSRLRDVSLVPESMAPEEAEALRAYYRAIRTNQSLKVVGKSPIFPKRYLGPASITAYRLSVLLSRIAGRLGFGLPVYGAPAGDDAAVLVWKSIESLGRLGILLQALPDARALHIVRHPCGFVASVERGEARQRFDDNRGASEDYNLLGMLLETEVGRAWGLSADDLRQMEPEERLAWRWAVFNDKALQDTDTAPALSFAYESLCDDPLSVARDLLDFCGLDWAPQVEAFVASSTSASESTYYSVFKDPSKAAWGWQKELPEPRVSRIMGIAERSRTWQRLYANRDIGARGVSAPNEV